MLGSQSFELPDLRPELRAAWAQSDRRVPMEPLSREEVTGYAAACWLPQRLTLAQQKALYNKTQGHPRYLACVCWQLLQAHDPDQVLTGADAFDGDLTAYYVRIWLGILVVHSAAHHLTAYYVRIWQPLAA
ncbi:hypothetical protein [Hymenobacter cheonanensis]|uniref:hypothetical protein n=1 Tax=Hymenobacter sp. CA2-7 TaxID=3063993 RepID=UPI0027129382|nr:hypothetical protein [Hymenobacter sp. CA2-7]MDO7886920.1 hypothetical protein [Hymenobacter sp. CA2-7]